MGLIINCYRCSAVLDEPGALIFFSPHDDYCVKRHLCATCEIDLARWLDKAAA